MLKFFKNFFSFLLKLKTEKKKLVSRFEFATKDGRIIHGYYGYNNEGLIRMLYTVKNEQSFKKRYELEGI